MPLHSIAEQAAMAGTIMLNKIHGRKRLVDSDDPLTPIDDPKPAPTAEKK